MKTALITGASRGLGRALALSLAREGYGLALVSRGRPALIETADEVRRVYSDLGSDPNGSDSRLKIGYSIPPLAVIAADVGSKESIHSIVLQALDALGSVDLLINNASDLGPVPLRALLDTECEELERVFRVNLVGPFRLTKALLPQMLLRSSGTVVNISSDAAVGAYPTWGAYGASKAALGQLTRIWAAELSEKGVRFHAIDPGEMDTRMHRDALPGADPSNLAQPEEVARRVLSEIGILRQKRNTL